MTATHFKGPLYIAGQQIVDGTGKVVADITAPTGSIGTAEIADAAVTPIKTNIAQAVTASTDGTGTGVISATTTFATVTSSGNTKLVTLPAPTPGIVVSIYVGANGYALQSSAPATVAINGGTGASAKTTLAASTLVVARCTTATAWVCTTYGADGTVAATTPAA